MTLKELFTTILSSHEEDWNIMSCGGHGAAPSYRSRFTFRDEREGERFVLEEESHHTVAAYKPDLSITMAWGLVDEPDFREPWATAFAHPHASSHWADVFFNGALVGRQRYVAVDGGRSKLPLPKSRNDLVVPLGYSYFVRLLDILTHKTQYTDYFRRAGFSTLEEEWPE